MALLDEAKGALRLTAPPAAIETEIADLIAAAQAELQLTGILPEKANSETDPLIKRAVLVYVKANFGWDNPDAEKYQQSFESLKIHLALSAEYTLSEEGTP